MNKKIILIILGIIMFSMLFWVLNKNNYNQKEKNKDYEVIDEILYKVNNKEDLLIYVTDSSDKCGGSCIDSRDIIRYYHRVYKLEFIKFDKNKESDKEYKTLINKLNIKNAIINVPAVIIIKEGIVKFIANIDTEEYLRKYLLESRFISENESTKDYQINYSEFEEIYVSNNTNLILIYSYGTINYKIREKLFNLSCQNDFKYNTLYVGTVDNSEIFDFLDKNFDDSYSIPIMLITKNSKIVDSITSNNTKKIKEFLNKNGFIK